MKRNGDPQAAAEFAEECQELGFETISMRDEFETIYKKDAVKTGKEAASAAE